MMPLRPYYTLERLMKKEKEKSDLKANRELTMLKEKYCQGDEVTNWLQNDFNPRRIKEYSYGCGLAAGSGREYESYLTICKGDGSGCSPGCQYEGIRDDINRLSGYGNNYFLNNRNSDTCVSHLKMDGDGSGSDILDKEVDSLCGKYPNYLIYNQEDLDRYFTLGSFELSTYVFQTRSVEKHTIWIIDGIPTIITHIDDNIAKGFILKPDFSLEPCYVAKAYGEYAHGRSIREARSALIDKIIVLLDYDYFGFCMDEFIDIFKNAYGSEIIIELKERWDEKE